MAKLRSAKDFSGPIAKFIDVYRHNFIKNNLKTEVFLAENEKKYDIFLLRLAVLFFLIGPQIKKI
jgi:hypothetical protein